MRIAFYAPLKPPDHPVPSGDRLMARLLLAALAQAGHHVEPASRLRARLTEPAGLATLEAAAAAERARIAAQWQAYGPPALWFSYHPYYRAPDLLGPALAARFGLPYVTAEASYAAKRNAPPWGAAQAHVRTALDTAALNLCFTTRDREGLARLVPAIRLADLPPFIAPPATPLPTSILTSASAGPPELIAVAMMRTGSKLASFRLLAAALQQLACRPWRLRLVGDGPARADVLALFAGLPAGRVILDGEQPPEAVAARLASADLYVWPGCGEAYGLAYLEAQAAGLAVVALRTAGVPAVVHDGETGLLTPPDDVAAYAGAIARLLDDASLRQRLGAAGRHFVHTERSLAAAAGRLCLLLAPLTRSADA